MADKFPADRIDRTIEACLQNGARLIDDSYFLEFCDPPSSQYFLIMIAQEEFSKAFIMFLVKKEIIPLSRPVMKAINDHACKQLVGMIMDFMIAYWDDIDELERMVSDDFELGDNFPEDIGSALEILRYEKIGGWEDSNVIYVFDGEYDKKALKVSKGVKDRKKQGSLYVKIAKDGQAVSYFEKFTSEEVEEELQKAERYKKFVQSALSGDYISRRYERTISAFENLFKDHPFGA